MIYLDHNATTFLDPAVLEAMQPILSGHSAGNPSSIHHFGQKGKALLAAATKAVATHFHVTPDEVIFTSGGTEALNMVIRSVPKGGHIISSSLEHIAVIEALKMTECSVTFLDPEPGRGAISPRQLEEALRPETAMIVLMSANNETGVKTALEPIAQLAFEVGVPLIVDGIASLGKEPIELYPGISAICFSGHKIYAPTGVGVAIVRKSFPVRPLIVGGPQQRGLRGGSENLASIVGFAHALTLLPKNPEKIAALRDRLETGLSDVVIHGIDEPRLCNTSNISFPGVDGETLLMQLDLAGVAVSHGSACSSGSLEPSRVLLSMGISPKLARSSLRFSLGRTTTEAEIDQTITLLTPIVKSLRSI